MVSAVADRTTIRTRIPEAVKVGYSTCRAMVVVGGAAVGFTRRRTTIIVTGIVLSFVVLAYLCWLLFALAVCALPFFAGATAALAAYDSGSGLIAGIVVGVITASIVVVLGRVAFAWLRSSVTRAALALLFIVPAAVAGYHATLGLVHLFVPAEAWRGAVAIAGATVVAVTAGVRLAYSPPPEIGQGRLPM
jgi:hypothetical protein